MSTQNMIGDPMIFELHKLGLNIAGLFWGLWLLFDGPPYSISGNLALLALPIALQEMVSAVWLIMKEFDPAAIASEVHAITLEPNLAR